MTRDMIFAGVDINKVNEIRARHKLEALAVVEGGLVPVCALPMNVRFCNWLSYLRSYWIGY